MSEDSAEGGAVFDYDELADHLLEQGLQASPSRLHGGLSGLLCAGAPAQPEYGLDALCAALDLTLHGELAAQVLGLYSATAQALQDDSFGFHPLLPDDDDIAIRARALADWCSGFLAGFAHASAAVDRNAPGLSGDSAEILRDIGAMAEAVVGDDESEDESEGSYIELVEYLRFATLNVYMDSRASGQAEGEGSLH